MDGPVRPPRLAAPFRLHDWLVQPSLNRISRGGTRVKLRPKVMDTLVHLAANAGEVVAKETLIDAVWAREFISDSGLTRAIFELRDALGDDPRGARFVETIPKRGYRLVAPVEPVELGENGGAAEWRRPLRRWIVLPVAAMVAVVALAAAVLTRSSRSSDGWTTKIVVLPFDNLGDPEDEFFAAGMTDEVTSRLAGAGGLGVVSPTSGGAAASPGRTVREIGRAFDADYVLEGAVRWQHAPNGQGRVRVTPKLLRVADDTVLWAEVLERDIGDALQVQSEIAAAVIARLGMAIESGPERRGGVSTASVEAYQAYLRGRYHEGRPILARHSLRVAAQMYERAVVIDPGFTQAQARLAIVSAKLFHHSGASETAHRDTALQALAEASRLEPGAPLVHLASALYHYWCERDYERAMNDLRAARAGLPGSTEALQAEAWILRRRGVWAGALERFADAERLDPRDPALLLEAAITRSFARRYAEAERTFARAIELAPDEPYPYLYRAWNRVRWDGDAAAALAVTSAVPDSDDPTVAFDLFWFRYLAGRHREALEVLAPVSEELAFTSFDCQVKPLLAALALAALGREEAARESFQQAAVIARRELDRAPENYRLHGALALALAGLREREAARAAGRRSVELCPLEVDAVSAAYQRANLATVHAMLGESDRALDLLTELLEVPAPISIAYVRLDPRWRELRDDPRLQALDAGADR